MAELITMPKLGFDMAEGKLGEWLKKPGEAVTQGETILLVETDKATVEVPAFRSGVLLDVLVPAGESVPIGTAIGIIGEAGEQVDRAALGLGGAKAEVKAEAKVEAAVEATAEAAPEAEAAAEGGRLAASPVAARMAGELGIDLRKVKGSGPGGRIIKRDIEAYLQELDKAPAAPPAPPPMPTPSYEPTAEGYRLEPLTGMRQTIARRMVESKTQAPHFYVTMEIDMAAAMALRSQINAVLPEAEKLSVNDLIVKASASALRKFPNVNASFAADGIRVHDAVNIGVAVARENGLVTAVLRDPDKKPLAQIGRESRELIARARGPHEARGHDRRDLHHQQPGHVRCGRVQRHHHAAPGRGVGRRRGEEDPRGGPRRPDRRRHAHEGNALSRSSRHRRRGGGPVPAGAQGRAGAADAAGGVDELSAATNCTNYTNFPCVLREIRVIRG